MRFTKSSQFTTEREYYHVVQIIALCKRYGSLRIPKIITFSWYDSTNGKINLLIRKVTTFSFLLKWNLFSFYTHTRIGCIVRRNF